MVVHLLVRGHDLCAPQVYAFDDDHLLGHSLAGGVEQLPELAPRVNVRPATLGPARVLWLSLPLI